MIRVLIVDDDRPLARALAINLKAHGYDVTVAPSPEAALDLHAAGEMFHLIMTDTSRPAGAGGKIAEALSMAHAWKKTPLLSLDAANLSLKGAA